MGKIEQGILGPFSGTVGTVVGASWRGVHYMRAKATNRTASSTPKQESQRARFQIMSKFLRQMSQIITPGFKRAAVQMTALNAALSYNLKNGIAGDYPNFEIAFNMLLLSRGDLPNAATPTATASANTITFNWVNNAGSGKALATDLVMVSTYCAALDMAICSDMSDTLTRSTGTLVLDVTPFSGLMVETYISFFSANGKEVSDSVYTGNVLLP